MNKSALVIIAVIVLPWVIIATAHGQDEMEFVDNDMFPSPQRTPAVFPHDAHNETAGIEECAGCHHLYEDGERVADESSEDQRCADCHNIKDSGSQPGLVKAFHVNCKGCHLQKKAGPILCGECHVR